MSSTRPTKFGGTMTRLFLRMVGFGVVMGLIFPPYASLFVEFREGMLLWFVLSCLGAGITVGLINYWLTRTVLVKPLRSMSAAVGVMVAGDLRRPIEASGNDELGNLAGSIEELRHRLAAFMTDLGQAAASLQAANQASLAVATEGRQIGQSASAATLRASQAVGAHSQTSDEALASIRSLMDVVEGLASGAREQAEQIAAVARNTHSMTGSVGDMAVQAAAVARTSSQAAGLARQGEESVKRNLVQMERVRHAVQETAGQMDALYRLAEEIGEVVQTVKAIAEQTNLLSLNASIEAARAGEHGRGFAVVADEVRKLAGMAGESTGKVRELVERIRASTRTAGETMRHCLADSQAGLSQSETALTVLRAINESVGETDRQVAAIAAAGSELDASGQQVTDAIQQVAAITEEYSASTEEIAVSCQRMEDQVQELQRAVGQTAATMDDMLASAEQIERLVGQYARFAADLGGLAERFGTERARYQV